METLRHQIQAEAQQEKKKRQRRVKRERGVQEEEKESAVYLQHQQLVLLPDMLCSTHGECSGGFQQSAWECAAQSNATRN